MMKFACFETIVEMVYKHAVPKPKEQCSKPLQLAVSFAGGYIAGVLCAAVSHPADNLVSFLNNAKGATVADVSCNSYPSNKTNRMLTTGIYTPALFQMVFNYIINIFELL
jgi:hypothetical protein